MESREELGFSFSLSAQERWDWFADRRQFVCTGQYERRRLRAHPFVIDWAEGADKKPGNRLGSKEVLLLGRP